MPQLDQELPDHLIGPTLQKVETNFAKTVKPIPELFGILESQIGKAASDYNALKHPNRRSFGVFADTKHEDILLVLGLFVGLGFIGYIYPTRGDFALILFVVVVGCYLFWRYRSNANSLAQRYARYLRAAAAYSAETGRIEYLKRRQAEIDKKEAAYLTQRAREAEEIRAKLSEIEQKKAILKRQEEYWLSLNGHEFEEEILHLLRAQHPHASIDKTRGSGDGGIDLVIVEGDEKTVVQCKAHKKPVGPHIVRDLYGAMHDARATRALLISLGGVTQGVELFIRDKPISVLDINHILEMQRSKDVPPPITTGNPAESVGRRKKRRPMPRFFRDSHE